jgi:UDP-2,3-diacylglucosamine hydrolase
MGLLVVSDTHIEDARDSLYFSVIRLIRERAEPGDTIVLSGDIFDLFIGSKKVFKERYSLFLETLRAAAARGCHIHYIEGNHDFLMRRVFKGMSGINYHERGFDLEVSGKKFYFAHGDTIDREDYGYLFLRAVLRNPVTKLIEPIVPGQWIDHIGRGSSQLSRKHSAHHRPVSDFERVRRLFRSFAAEQCRKGFDFVVLGHCHDLDEMIFSIGERQAQYINVGYPRVHGSFLSWSPGDQKIQREALPPPAAG